MYPRELNLESRPAIRMPSSSLKVPSGRVAPPSWEFGAPFHRVLMIDNGDPEMAVIRSRLLIQQIGVLNSRSPAEGMADLCRERPDLVVADLDISKDEGLDAIVEMRNATSIPILIVSAPCDVSFRIEALELGANDIITKPVECDELAARIRAALRFWTSDRTLRSRLDLGEIQLDRESREVTVRGRKVQLTSREFSVLLELAAHPGKVVSHNHLLERVWGSKDPARIGSLRVFIRELRRKIEFDPANPTLLVNVQGLGYRLGGVGAAANGALPFDSAAALTNYLREFAASGRTAFLKAPRFANLAEVDAAAEIAAAEFATNFVIETNPNWKGVIVHFNR